ncbi:M20/M25/M40 family metallo-hydrolase [Clostridium botulinum]|nr:M20/M25/M40 family metallo-hydrolase [Clostridium botulinum]NFS95397.1 M20/M25/M40 family metallo-hydrolase [Clostridium botulinum]
MKNIAKILLGILLLLNITSCSIETEQQEATKNNMSKEVISQEQTPSTIEIVNKLCSDEFGGRLVGSEGNEKAANYISGIFRGIGLEPLNGENYYMPHRRELYTQYELIYNNDKSENKVVNNVVGVIKGKDSEKAIVISAHFDHIGYKDGQIIRGALDNASGVAALMKIANILNNQSKNRLFDRDIIIASFNGEEKGRQGSKAFANDIKDKYSSLYNINIDCVGGKEAGKISLNNKSKISDKLTNQMKKTFKDNQMKFSDKILKNVTSDHKSFEKSEISNIFIGQDNLEPYVHNIHDNPESLNYDEIDKVVKVICDFIEKNHEYDF